MTTGDTGTGTDSENYFQSWISDKEPKAPEGWGIDVFRGTVDCWNCEACWKKIEFRQQYLYSFQPSGAVILHNKKECYERFIG